MQTALCFHGNHWLPNRGPKLTRELLWSDNQHKPGRVYPGLATLDSQLQKSLGQWQGSLRRAGSSTPLHEVQRLCDDGQLERALDVLWRMDQQGTAPSEKMYSSLLKACAQRKALSQARQVHSHLYQRGLESRFLGENVVSTLVKCGSLEDAVEVFHSLPERTVFSWTALISGHTMAGQGQEALRLYRCMREQGVEPDKYTFVSLLSACGSLGDLEEGRSIHAEALKYGCESDVFVGTSLIDMYGKCGSMVDAQDVFAGLSQRNVVSWNVLISANTQQGRPGEALHLYIKMREEGVSPDSRTFVGTLQACSSLAEKEDGVLVNRRITKVTSLQKGKSVHADAQRKGQGSDVFFCSALIHLYSKCGSIVDAQNVFDGLYSRNVVLWNVMVSAYAQQGEPSKALQLYAKMRAQNICPDDRTFVSVIQACGLLAETEEDHALDTQSIKVASLDKGKALHSEAWRKGYSSDIFVCSTLVSMYAKCGTLIDAENAHNNGLGLRNVVSWNAMVAAFVEQDQAATALQVYVEMREEGVSPDVRTFVGAIQACAMLVEEAGLLDGQPAMKGKSLEIGKALHAEAQRKGYDLDVFIANSLISMYGITGSTVDAEIVFEGLSQRDVVSWNAMLAAYVEHGQAEDALELYEQMRSEDSGADGRTFLSALQACAMFAEQEDDVVVDGRSVRVKALAKGKELHADVRRQGHESHLFVGCTLVKMYGKCGSVVDALHVFDGLPYHDSVSWTTMLGAYVEQGEPEKCLRLYGHMLDNGMIPDEFALVYIFQACCNIGSLNICRQMHQSHVSTGNCLTLRTATTLVHAYGRCASMVEAQYVFDGMPQHDVASWNALIAGYARQGSCEACLRLFEEMQLSGFHPNGITFLSILSACSHAGLLHQGLDYFDSMSRDHDITPVLDHYVTMVDLLGRAGCFTEAEALLTTMPVQPSLAMWMCLLGACQKHGKVYMAKQAFERAVHLEPRYAPPYLLMANIYADAGYGDRAREVHEMRRKACAWKQPGRSWIELAQEVHNFVVGNGTHAQDEELHSLLGKIRLALEKQACMLRTHQPKEPNS